jgi:membrane peptidoglycan carboxypeptidase
LKPSKTYLRPPPGYRFRRPWYFRPWFYIPVAILAVMALFITVFFSSVVVDLQAQANSFDLSKLEQMESASVILDRNGKIFGQIYVENRETVPYEKLAPDLINAVIAVEDAKFYEHHGYDLLGIIRAALKNLTAGHVVRAAAPSHNSWRATVSRSKKEHIAGSCWRFFWPSASKTISANRKSSSCT